MMMMVVVAAAAAAGRGQRVLGVDEIFGYVRSDQETFKDARGVAGGAP